MLLNRKLEHREQSLVEENSAGMANRLNALIDVTEVLLNMPSCHDWNAQNLAELSQPLGIVGNTVILENEFPELLLNVAFQKYGRVG